MEKVKKIFLKTLIVVLSIIAVLYSINFIDNKINGQMYLQIDNYYEAINTINHSPEGITCAKQSIYPADDKPTNEIKSARVTNAQNSCQYVIEEIKRIKTPTNLPKKREKLLIEVKNDTIDMYQDCTEILKLKEKFKKNSIELERIENPYHYDIMKKAYYMTAKISEVKVRNNIKSRARNMIGKIYITLTKNEYEKKLKILYGKENE